MMNTVLILVCGLPGSGKSFFAKHLSKTIHSTYFNSDLLRKELFPESRTYSEREKQHVYDTMIANTKKELEDKHNTVVVDATFYRNELRIPFYELARTNNFPIYIFYVTAAEELVKERTSRCRSDSEADYSVYLKLKDLYEPIDLPYATLISTQNNIDKLLSEALFYLNHGKK